MSAELTQGLRSSGLCELADSAVKPSGHDAIHRALIGEAATLARTHGEMLAHLPATVHAFILVELQKWPTLFQPEQRYQRALLEHLSRLPKSSAGQRDRRDRADRRTGRRQQGHRSPSRRLPGCGAGAAAPARAAGRLAQRGRRLFPDHRSGARGPALSRRCTAASRRSDLWERHCGPARQTVESLQRRRCPRAAGPGRDEGHRTISPAAARRAGGWRRHAGLAHHGHRAVPARRVADRIARSASRPLRRGTDNDVERRADRIELRPSAPVPRRSDAGAQQQDSEWSGEPAGLCRIRPKPPDRPACRARCSTPPTSSSRSCATCCSPGTARSS